MIHGTCRIVSISRTETAARGLKVDAITDAVGSQIMPMGGVDTGLGGTAPRLPANPAPWLLTIAAGALLTGAGLAGLRRRRRTAL